MFYFVFVVYQVWGFTKDYVEKRNSKFTMEALEAEYVNACSEIEKRGLWANYVQHVQKTEQKYWELEHIMETTVHPAMLKISLGNNKDLSNSNSSVMNSHIYPFTIKA